MIGNEHQVFVHWLGVVDCLSLMAVAVDPLQLFLEVGHPSCFASSVFVSIACEPELILCELCGSWELGGIV